MTITTAPALIRQDGRDKVTGSGRYTADMTLTGMIYGALRTAGVPHARIRRIDTSEARGSAGRPRGAHGRRRPRRAVRRVPPGSDAVRPGRRALGGRGDRRSGGRDARDRRPGGRADRCRPRDRSRRSSISRRLRTPEPRSSTRNGRPTDGDENLVRDGNLASRSTIVKGDADRAMADADIVVRDSYEADGSHAVPIEPRAIVAEWSGDQVTIWSSTQVPFGVRTGVAETLEPASEPGEGHRAPSRRRVRRQMRARFRAPGGRSRARRRPAGEGRLLTTRRVPAARPPPGADDRGARDRRPPGRHDRRPPGRTSSSTTAPTAWTSRPSARWPRCSPSGRIGSNMSMSRPMSSTRTPSHRAPSVPRPHRPCAGRSSSTMTWSPNGSASTRSSSVGGIWSRKGTPDRPVRSSNGSALSRRSNRPLRRSAGARACPTMRRSASRPAGGRRSRAHRERTCGSMRMAPARSSPGPRSAGPARSWHCRSWPPRSLACDRTSSASSTRTPTPGPTTAEPAARRRRSTTAGR